MAAAQAVLTSLIFLLAIRRGEGGLSATELVMIAVAGAGVIGWIVVRRADRRHRLRRGGRPDRRGDDGRRRPTATPTPRRS